jgi:segregation and condensation protein B
MSLRAKIEAVIYAAEEPVTLAQLAAVFASDLPPAPEIRPDDQPGDDQPSAETLIERGYLSAVNDGAEDDLAQIALLSAQEETKPARMETPAPNAAAAEAEAKRAARQRERELRDRLKAVVDELIQEYAAGDRGMEIREVAGGYRIATKPEYHDAVRSFVKSLKPAMKLSLQALETLAVIAYKQPVTAPEVSEIRGVESGGVLGTLVSRKLITTAGRKQVIGRPILYKTTREFLLRFGLKDLNELPSIEEFEKLAGDVEIEVDNTIPEEPALPFNPEEVSDPSDATGIGAPSLPTASSSEEAGFTDSPVEAFPTESKSQATLEPAQSAAAELGTGAMDPLDSSAPVAPHPPQTGEIAVSEATTPGVAFSQAAPSTAEGRPEPADGVRFANPPTEASATESISDTERHHD